MGRPTKAPGGLAQFNMRMPEQLIEELDEEVQEEIAAHPGRVYTRSDLIREILTAHVQARKGKRKGAKKR